MDGARNFGSSSDGVIAVERRYEGVTADNRRFEGVTADSRRHEGVTADSWRQETVIDGDVNTDERRRRSVSGNGDAGIQRHNKRGVGIHRIVDSLRRRDGAGRQSSAGGQSIAGRQSSADGETPTLRRNILGRFHFSSSASTATAMTTTTPTIRSTTSAACARSTAMLLTISFTFFLCNLPIVVLDSKAFGDLMA